MIQDLLDIGSYEVAWDYCLENNIIMPGMFVNHDRMERSVYIYSSSGDVSSRRSPMAMRDVSVVSSEINTHLYESDRRRPISHIWSNSSISGTKDRVCSSI